ncbi:phage tail sheath subtilisin-like domain-containing protein [Breoghania sp. L-A4]|uniref:phage tail sheath subtilisin-like domain-containing protein n=1 Tax=Breoghania sp. L-A4 TaxID=2304600 RepID=UPI000E35C99F|nr:phage tail sheath subtilisin-like domain-containing protein [Breoghania sp. L-A4]AXS39275.1 phage tail protein [Breoghania sp. L-A4]
MADIAFHHGTRISQSAETPVLIRTAQSAVVGIIGTAADADADAFPLNTPVLLKGQQFAKAAKLGAAGTLKDAVDAVNAQIGTYMVIVRVEDGEDTADTMSNLVGDPATMTGVHAFLKARSTLSIKPRLICAPGYTGGTPADGIQALQVTAGGTGYSDNPTVTITDAGAGAGAEAKAIVAGGILTGLVVTRHGAGYSDATVTITDASGTLATATATIGAVANPVVVELAGVLDKLKAVAWVDGPDTTDEAATIYRGLLNSRRIKVVDPRVLVWDSVFDAYVPMPAAPYFVGVQARMDRERGFWWSESNKPINGIAGINRPVSYGDQTDYLNENDVATIVNIDGTGFRTWGNRGCGSESLWKFFSVVRTADFINEALEAAFLEFVDRPFSKANLKLAIESGNAFLRTLRAEGAILGGKMWIDQDLNEASELAQGRITFSVEFEPPAPMEDIRIIAYRNILYYDRLIADVVSEIEGGALTAA